MSAPAPAAVGVAEHCGWAVFVTAARMDGAPRVLDRRRVALKAADLPSLPYHHTTFGMAEREAEALVAKVKASAADAAAAALDAIAQDVAAQADIGALALRPPTLDKLPDTVAEAQASPHINNRADAMIFHFALTAAARARGWAIALTPRGKELDAAGRALGLAPAEVADRLDALRGELGPPWTKDHRFAAAAAMAALG